MSARIVRRNAPPVGPELAARVLAAKREDASLSYRTLAGLFKVSRWQAERIVKMGGACSAGDIARAQRRDEADQAARLAEVRAHAERRQSWGPAGYVSTAGRIALAVSGCRVIVPGGM